MVASCAHYNNFGIWFFGCDTVLVLQAIATVSALPAASILWVQISQIQIHTTLEKSNLCRTEHLGS